jgi:hypothetical protein
MISTDEQDVESSLKSDVQQKGESSLSSKVQLTVAKSTNLADAEDAEVSNISGMPVVDIMIPKSLQQGARHIVLTLPKNQDASTPWLQSQEGQGGSFFSIHSTIQQPVTCTLDKTERSKCCLCCAYSSATLEERWNPYHPGEKKCS